MPKQKHEDKMLIFRCHQETILRVKAIAAAEGRTVSAQIRQMIDDYPLKPRFIKAAKNSLSKNPRAKPKDIISEALEARYPSPAEGQGEPPLMPPEHALSSSEQTLPSDEIPTQA